MPFHLMNYNVNAGVNDANVDMTATTDSVFTIRNNHFIFSEQYYLYGLFYHAASALRARSNIPSWNSIGRHVIHPPFRSLTIPDNIQVQDFRDSPIPIPINEEIAWEETNNLGAATERTNVWMWVGPRSPFVRNIPVGVQDVIKRTPRVINLRFTVTITTVANAWSGLNNITMADNIRGGWYAVVGSNLQAANSQGFRFYFPRAPYVGSRQFRPGSLCQEAIGNKPLAWNDWGLGYWGYFHSFELPQIEVFATAAAATAHEGRLAVVYLGDAAPAEGYSMSV